MSASSEIFLFGEFRLDRAGGGLFRRDAHGVFVPVAVGSRAVEILAALVERRGDIVSKEEIVDAGWPRTVVAEGNLFVQIAALRRILDGAQPGQSCIQTVIGRGYRFVAPVTRGEPASLPTSSSISGDRGGGPEAEDQRGISLAAALPTPDKPSIAWPLYVKLELRASTNSQRMRERAVMISSTMPSAKYSCSESLDRL